MILNSFEFETGPSMTGSEDSPVSPGIEILLLTGSVTSKEAVGGSGARAVGTRGTLKKPKTSRYSSSLGARFLDWAGPLVGEVWGEERGWREMRKSRSKAQRRMSARILTVEGVERSVSVFEDCWYSPYSSRTRWRMELYRSATFQCSPMRARVFTKKRMSGLTVRAMVEPWTRRRRAETQREKAKGGPSLESMLLSTTERVTERMLSTARRQRWLALYDGVKIGERVVGYAAEE